MSNSGLLAVILALLVATFGREPAAVAETKSDAAKAAPASPNVVATPPEIEFFLARGEAGVGRAAMNGSRPRGGSTAAPPSAFAGC